VCPSLAANRTRLGGVRAEAQMRVVVNVACDDDDDDGVCGRADALGVSPQSLEETKTLDQSTKTLKEGKMVVSYEFKEGWRLDYRTRIQ